jgi:ABC-2 type transport system permease protein
MFYEIYKFELRSRMKRLSTYIFFGVFFLITFLLIAALGGAMKGVSVSVSEGGKGNVFANAPYVLHILISVIGLFGVMNVAGIMGNAAYRDFEQKTFSLYFSYPIKKYSYIAGRFLAGLTVLLFVFSSIALGAAVASVMPFVAAEKFGSNSVMAYIMPYLTAIIPNLVFTGAIF